MRLLDLNIENYGIYSARHFDFSGPGFRLIYGPNEAGKSTLLQVIREVLFGFPHVSPYVFESHTGRLAATARMELQNGRRVRFRRHKGTKNTVTGEIEATRQAVDDASLHELLGRAGGDLFEHVFGISLKELTAGEKSLEHANLTEALYGSGVGGLAGFQRLQQSLHDEHSKLFSPRGRKPAVNRLLGAISEKSQLLRESAVRPREYNELQETLENCSHKADALSIQIEELRLQERRLERLESALDAWSHCRVLREELSQLTDSGHVPVDAADRFRQVRERLHESRDTLIRLEHNLAMLPDPIGSDADRMTNDDAQPALDEKLARRLSQDVTRIRDCMRRVPQLLEESQEIRRTLADRVRQLNPDWSIDELGSLQATQPQREQIRELEVEWSKLEQLETSLSSQRPELQRQLDATQLRLDSLADDSEDVLAAQENLVERSAEWSANRGRLAELQSEAVRVAGELEALRNRLQSACESDLQIDAIRSLVLPLPAEVEAARKLQDTLTLETRRTGEQLQERQQELTDAEKQLREQEASESVVTLESLTVSREERDISWRMIRRHLLEATPIDQSGTIDDDADRGTGTTSLPVPEPEEFERSIAAADSLADERFANAESVARREHLVVAVDRAHERVEAAQTLLQQKCAACETAEIQWRKLWPEGIHPGAPEAMLEWLRLHGEFVQLAQRRDELDADARRVVAAVEAFEAELIRALQTPLQSPEASLAVLREQGETLRRNQSERRRLTAELPDLQARLTSLDDERQQSESRKAAWRVRWTSMAAQLGLPSDWSVQTAGRLLNQLAELQLQQREAESLERQSQTMQNELTEFESHVASLKQMASTEVQSLSAVDAVVEVVSQIDASRQSAIDHQELVSQRTDLVRQIELQRVQEQQAEQQIAALLAECRASNPDEFLSRVEAGEERRQLTEQLELRERDIRVIRGNEDEAAFLTELQGLTPESVSVRRQTLQHQITQLEADREQSLRQAGAVRTELDGLNSNVDSIQMAAELESLRSELGSAVDTWAGLVITRTLMTKALARFEREHQPRMLVEVARLLSRMTDGRYTGIERKLDRTGTLLVRDSFGKLLEPAALSTGTREQLYLAIRLAFVLEYCEDSEPLPLIMDDTLVNFDHKRTRNTLRVLGEVSQRVQVLFLTCHRHMIDMAAETIPDSEPMFLHEEDRLSIRSVDEPLHASVDAAPVATVPPPRLTRKNPEQTQPAGSRQPELF